MTRGLRSHRDSPHPRGPEDGTLTRRQALSMTARTTAALVLSGRLWAQAPDGPREVSMGTAQFLAAVERGDASGVSALLDRNPELLTARDERGRSAFVIAHVAGHPEVARIFTTRGLELDLVEAVLAEDKKRIEELAKASPSLVNKLHPIGGTAHYAAARFGRPSVIFPLNRWGGDPNVNPLGAAGVTAVRAAMDCPDADGCPRPAPCRMLARSPPG